MSHRTGKKMKMTRLSVFIEKDKEKAVLFQTAHCPTCSLAEVEEIVVSADDFRAVDPSGEVKFLVGYRFTCPKSLHDGYHDTPKAATICKEGNNDAQKSCANCRYAVPVVIGIQSGVPKRKEAAKWGRIISPKCTVTRLMYRCTNQKRMKQFDTGTVMSTYIRCDQHEEMAEDVKDKQPREGLHK